MVEPSVKSEQQDDLFLPPGFRFHPTDEEIITSYLLQKFLNPSFAPRAVGEVDLNKCEPWELPSKAKMGEMKEWYFFCHKDMKYPTGTRTNRATKVGYWKATGKDREIFKPASASGGGARELVGMKKTLVFYMCRAPRGSKTNWVMHEYRLEGKSKDNANLRFNPKDEWVVSKVFHKQKGDDDKAAVEHSAGTLNVSSVEAAEDDDQFLDSMMDPMYFNSTTSSLPNSTTASNAAAPPYNSDYSISSTTAATPNTSSFPDLPNYSSLNHTTGSGNLHQVAVANPTLPRSSSSLWNMFHADYAMGSYSLYHQQAMMVKALGRVISPNYAGGSLLSSSSVTGILQQNSQQKLGNYVDSHAMRLTSSAALTTTIGPDAKNLGAGVVRY